MRHIRQLAKQVCCDRDAEEHQGFGGSCRATYVEGRIVSKVGHVRSLGRVPDVSRGSSNEIKRTATQRAFHAEIVTSWSHAFALHADLSALKHKSCGTRHCCEHHVSRRLLQPCESQHTEFVVMMMEEQIRFGNFVMFDTLSSSLRSSHFVHNATKMSPNHNPAIIQDVLSS